LRIPFTDNILKPKDVPMDKDQLAAWRREQRRVRNRESAAASRQRIRSRICELEDEVGQWKEKYTEAMQRLEALEAAMGPQALAAAAAAQGAGK
jgi:chromosome segregation ATPase